MLSRQVKDRIAENKHRRAFSTKTRRMLKAVGMSQRAAAANSVVPLWARHTKGAFGHFRKTARHLAAQLKDHVQKVVLYEDEDHVPMAYKTGLYDKLREAVKHMRLDIGSAVSTGQATPIPTAEDIEKAFFDAVGVGGLGPDKRAGELTVELLKARTTPSEFKVIPIDMIGDYILKNEKEE